MDLLAQYGSGSDDSSPPPAAAVDEEAAAMPEKVGILRSTQVAPALAAPEVSTAGWALTAEGAAVGQESTRHLQDPSTRTVYFNPTHDDLHAPVAGPAHPFQQDGVARGLKNHRSGFVEDAFLSAAMFDTQYETFNSQGYAIAPDGGGYAGDTAAASAARGATYATGAFKRKGGSGAVKKKEKKLREETAAAADPSAAWAPRERPKWWDLEAAAVRPAKLSAAQEAEQAAVRAAAAAEEAGETAAAAAKADYKTHFHGKEAADYQGRSWIECPKDRRKRDADAGVYLPKRCVHTWSGHTAGVTAIRFFPGTGHLLLSASNDSKIKIWDVHGSGKCMRDYMGHTKGVREVNFTNDGRRFVSTAYDNKVRLWDTETGQVLQTLHEGKMFYCAEFHVDEDKQNVLLAGCHDKKIYQFDLDSGDIVQQYDYHLAAVNCVKFVDDGRKFVSTSDDRTMRVWEYGIPVEVKQIADPSLKSMTSLALHPTKPFMVAQHMDNTILTFSCKDRVKQKRDKLFKGHTNSAQTVQVSFSPNGEYVTSGDVTGGLYFWKWDQCRRIAKSLRAHPDASTVGAIWHPRETSKVATCGTDGLIKYWD